MSCCANHQNKKEKKKRPPIFYQGSLFLMSWAAKIPSAMLLATHRDHLIPHSISSVCAGGQRVRIGADCIRPLHPGVCHIRGGYICKNLMSCMLSPRVGSKYNAAYCMLMPHMDILFAYEVCFYSQSLMCRTLYPVIVAIVNSSNSRLWARKLHPYFSVPRTGKLRPFL